MKAHARKIVGVIAAVAFGHVAAAQATGAASPIRAFDWTYQGASEPGNRHWTSPDGVTWTETYPSGRLEMQKFAAAAEVNGCKGVITLKSASPATQTFIPGPGCPTMTLLLRMGDGAWRPLGDMRSINTAVTAAGSPPDQAQADPMFGALATMLKPPTDPPAKLTPERIALARRYLAMMHLDQSFSAFGQVAVAQLKSQLDSQLKSLAPAQQAIVRKASLDALRLAQEDYEKVATARLETYLAGHISPADFEETFAFYSTPLGSHLLPPFTPMTPDERQEMGRYSIAHPALQRVSGAQFGAMQMALAERQKDQAMMLATFKSHFCDNLEQAHFKSQACTAPPHP